MQSPPSAAADARNRAWRTFLEGLAVDVTAAIALSVGPSLAGSDFAWSRAYWLSLAGLAAKTGLIAGIAYVARRVKAPAV